MSKASTITARPQRELVTGRALPPSNAALVSFKEGVAAVVAAERQGFDDGYFGQPRQNVFPSQAECIAYDREFEIGVKQRAAADKSRK
jgi:hypothetical protein